MKTLIAISFMAIASLTANAYFLYNVYNISLVRSECSEVNNVNIKNCQLRVVNLTPKETEAQKLTLLLPPELQ